MHLAFSCLLITYIFYDLTHCCNGETFLYQTRLFSWWEYSVLWRCLGSSAYMFCLFKGNTIRPACHSKSTSSSDSPTLKKDWLLSYLLYYLLPGYSTFQTLVCFFPLELSFLTASLFYIPHHCPPRPHLPNNPTPPPQLTLHLAGGGDVRLIRLR